MFSPTLIKSIQRGVITLSGVASNTAAIASVNPANCRLVWLGTYDTTASTTPDLVCCRVEFTNATTITAYVNTATTGATVSFEVIEYVPGVIKSVQRSTFAVTGSTAGTGTITAVTTSKAQLDYLGFTTTYTGATVVGQGFGRLVLTNATTLTFNGLGSMDRTVGYQVTEFF